MTPPNAAAIERALRHLAEGDLKEQAKALFDLLGYRSDRTGDSSGAVDDFLTYGDYEPTGTKDEEAFKEEAKAVYVLFQITEDEVRAGVGDLLGEDAKFNSGNSQSFVFVTAELGSSSYTRGQYAAFTREINKRLPMPVVVLFRTAAKSVSLAFVHRRPSKINADRDVLGHVSLVREVRAEKPHPAHPKILQELSLHKRLEWMHAHGPDENFDGLLDAWLVALDTQELNEQFYKELLKWFEHAVTGASFPEDTGQKPEKHIIRLITRLLFIWFIKEKGLVAEDLFVEKQVQGLLKGYDRDKGDSYYRAVLQNLFFAVLNTEIGKRDFSKQSNETHRDPSRYRYRSEMKDEIRLLELFSKTPFINGGLFDCLDDFEGVKAGGKRTDYFTDNKAQRRGYSMPNHLFFGSRGLITLLNRYHFTVEENTPVEQEVALDPELLGRTFENLLATYNPETQATARKETGSFYTPREVVDYMVDQALVESLTTLATTKEVGWWRDRLGYLLDYADACDDAWELFDAKERKRIVAAVAKMKVIDPAVGSGAFPMGVLHKLTLLLRRLDPDDALWRQVQRKQAKERAGQAFDQDDKEQREKDLREINELFGYYSDTDFGRKLYLIQNSIFGVDIQPVACQIAKLRFFISLAIEQQPNGDPGANYGIRPLPNLETRFIAADTLLGLGNSDQLSLADEEQRSLEQKLSDSRERYFHAATREAKLQCRRNEKELRNALERVLEEGGWDQLDARRVASWDPYDQNAEADWFDAGYMFGVRGGFDIVIGNPPYIPLQDNGGRLGTRYASSGYTTFARRGDIYQLFYERGMQLLKPGAHLCYITSNKWMRAGYGEKLRSFFSQKYPKILLDFGGFKVFKSATVDTNILLIANMPSSASLRAATIRDDFVRGDDIADYVAENVIHLNVAGQDAAPHSGSAMVKDPGHPSVKGAPWIVSTPAELALKEKIESIGTPLREWDISIYSRDTHGL